MDVEVLVQIGFTKIQAKIYLYLIEHGQSTSAEIAKGIDENRTTVYSAIERLVKLDILIQRNKGKIRAYFPNHPSVLEGIAEKRLRVVAKQARTLEGNLPSLINYYNEYQDTPGAMTFYGQEGIQMIWNKVISEKAPYYFVRSRYDKTEEGEDLDRFREERVKAGIKSENITPSEYTDNTNKEVREKYLLERTLLPPNEYDSPVEIDIFGDNVAFINYTRMGCLP